MTNFTIGRWLLVALAIVGLALAAPAVSAHDNETTADDAPPYDGNAAGWAAWMEAQMTDHMGPGAVEWMEDHMGMTIDEMAQDMADGGHNNGGHNNGGHNNGGMYGQGQGC